MDVIIELAKTVVAFVALFVVLIAVPILFILIFSIATGFDERMNR